MFSKIYCKKINKYALELEEDFKKIEIEKDKAEKGFEDLKRLNLSFAKMNVKAKDYEDKSEGLAKENKRLKETSLKVYEIIGPLLKLIIKDLDTVRKIIRYNNKLILNQEKFLDRLYDKDLDKKIKDKIITLRENMKSSARKLYEMENLEEKKAFSERKYKINKIIKKISDLGIEFEHLIKKKAEIKHVLDNTEKGLLDLNNIEESAEVIIPYLENAFEKVKTKAYLLHEDVYVNAKDSISNSKERFDSIRYDVKKDIEKLFLKIKIN